ncbi:MAG: hypothetical protein EOM51_05495 [Clostridia bacterium]|nr:hypothetical protein [Clostridia bacterium]
MATEFNLNVFLQNNDYVRRLEADRDEALRREAEWRIKCKQAQDRLADAQHVNLELIDTLQLNGFKFRRTADMRNWKL